MSRVCAMGCERYRHQSLHRFPKDVHRRAEWCRILGVYPRTKRAYLCNKHIPECYLFGNRLSKFAMPSPPDSRQANINSQMSASTSARWSNYEAETFLIHRPHERFKTSMPNIIESQNLIENEVNADNFADDSLANNIKQAENESVESQEKGDKVEDFEIRKGSNNDMIIKGRFFQTNDYLVVSYTPPRKWTLQEQVKILDQKCEQQLRQIRQINKENNRLSMELRKHEKLLPKLRYLRTHNRYLYAQLKMYKIDEKNRRKRIKEKKLKEKRLLENQNIPLE